ncbi:MAG: transporter substrate-binding domain-containing protein [Candidatus Stygibacter australis]|nr:transporter substrate-binding domain-containing protein [Candidatus Stygibacter australis]MDP8321781.1 transporter substrate-binding domain-containing protein [Candidatus Stygibacter australis]
MNRKLIYVIVILIFIINLSAATVTESDKTLIIGCEPDYPPYCIVNSEGEGEGFSIDLIKAALDTQNLKYEIKVDIWNNLKFALYEGKIDALPLVGRTPEREPYFDFTFPYISLHGAIFVRKGEHRIKSISDLKDKEIVVMAGDNAEEFVRRGNVSDFIITTSTFQEAFEELDKGNYDAVITQRVMGLHLLNELEIFSIAPLSIDLSDFRQDFCFGVKEGNKELLAKLNEGLAVIISNGDFKDISQKWFTPELDHSLMNKYNMKMAAYIFIPLILFLLIVMQIYMRKEIKRKTAVLQEEVKEHEIARKKLIASEKKFRSYVDKAPTGIFVSDEEGYYLDVNSAACRITGYDRDELIGMHLSELIDPEYRKEAEKSFASLSETGESSGEIPFITKSGEKRYWRVDASVLTNYTFLGFAVDTTDKWLANHELQKSRDQLQNLFDNMISSFAFHKLILDEAGKPLDFEYIEVNRAFEKMLGIKKEDIIGKRFAEAFPGIENDPADWIGTYGKVALNGLSIKFENYSEKIGKWFLINAYSPIKGYFATISEDITARKKNEEELTKYRENLEELIKERTSELQESNKELVRYNKLFIGREFRIKELRDQVKELEKTLEN